MRAVDTNILARFYLRDDAVQGRIAADVLSAGDVFVPKTVILELEWVLRYVADQPEDKVLEANGVKVYVDGNSVSLLSGSQIDYVDTLMGAGFTVNNPNAVAACGCGSSFRTADSAGQAGACHH